MKSAPSTRGRNKNRALTPIFALLLGACASLDGELAAARESWRGATYDQVLMAWGPPSQSGKDSHTWLTYDEAVPAQRAGGGAGGVVFGGGSGARCDRTLAFRDGRVVDERWVGDAEFCKRFARRAR
jgi:hypothetical protein